MDARVRSNRRIGAPPFTAIPRRFCRIGAERLSGLPVKIALTPRVGASPGEEGDFLEGGGNSSRQQGGVLRPRAVASPIQQ